jgi:hypothetical protein
MAKVDDELSGRPTGRNGMAISTCTRSATVIGIGILATTLAGAWEQDDRFGNVPFFKGRPMQAQKRPMSFATAAQVEVRLKGSGWFGAFEREDVDKRSTAILQNYRGVIPRYGGVRDERYFLISLDPGVVVIAPFRFELKYKTADQMRVLSDNVTSELLNPMYQQIIAQQSSALANGLARGLLAEIPGPNYVEIGCAFPDVPGSVVLAPSLGSMESVFDLTARIKLKERLGLEIRRHPSIAGYWQLAGCPT